MRQNPTKNARNTKKSNPIKNSCARRHSVKCAPRLLLIRGFFSTSLTALALTAAYQSFSCTVHLANSRRTFSPLPLFPSPPTVSSHRLPRRMFAKPAHVHGAPPHPHQPHLNSKSMKPNAPPLPSDTFVARDKYDPLVHSTQDLFWYHIEPVSSASFSPQNSRLSLPRMPPVRNWRLFLSHQPDEPSRSQRQRAPPLRVG